MEKLLTTKDAGNQLGVTPLRVFQLIKAGRLPAVKIGRDWMIQEKDLEKVKDRKPGRPKGQLTKKQGEVSKK